MYHRVLKDQSVDVLDIVQLSALRSGTDSRVALSECTLCRDEAGVWRYGLRTEIAER